MLLQATVSVQGLYYCTCANHVLGLALSEDRVVEHVWKKWMPHALKSGQLKCLPDAEIVGYGIDKVNQACELIQQGVSGKKLVVVID